MPALRYRNVPAAIDWLCGAFGFERHDVVTAVDGTILHARLMFGNDMILILPVRDDSGLASSAGDAGAAMQSCYFVVDDADALPDAKCRGETDSPNTTYGARLFVPRPGGHLWIRHLRSPPWRHAPVDHWRSAPVLADRRQPLRLRTVATLEPSAKVNPR